MSAMRERCIAGADGQPWPCRSARLVASRGAVSESRIRSIETAASSPMQHSPTDVLISSWSRVCDRAIVAHELLAGTS